MKIISTLCIFLTLAAMTAAFAQEKAQPGHDTLQLLPNNRTQNSPVHIPYIILPQQEIDAQTYGGQYLPEGSVVIPWQNPEIVHPNVRVELNLNRAPLSEALKKLFTQVKLDFTLEKDVPADARVTLRLKNVTFLTALNAITEEANVGWSADTTGVLLQQAAKYHIGKNLSNRSAIRLPLYPLVSPQNNYWYWNLQPNSDNKNQFDLYYNLKPDANLNTGSDLNNTLKLPLNYNFNLKINLTPSIDAGNTIRLPLNLHYTPDAQPYGSASLKVDTSQQGAAPLTDKAAPTQQGIPVLKDIPLIGRLFTVHGKEEHSIFTCPHCHQEITVITKQNSTAGAWKFCPICGKAIGETEKKSHR